jgi:hypothetical protein
MQVATITGVGIDPYNVVVVDRPAGGGGGLRFDTYPCRGSSSSSAL